LESKVLSDRGRALPTRGGAFFIVEHVTIGEDAEIGGDVIKTRMSKCSEEAAAEAEGLSANAWVMRCFEKCLDA
jgi:hypothetical protein